VIRGGNGDTEQGCRRKAYGNAKTCDCMGDGAKPKGTPGFYEIAERALALERAGRRVARLNVGDTNLPTPQCAIDAACGALKQAKSGYGPSAGLPELRERIAEREGCDAKNVVVGPGSKHLIFGLLSVICKKGDNVAFPAPFWPAYPLACSQLGLKAKALASTLEGNWAFDNGEAAAAGAKALIICNPLNPTSTVYPKGALEDAVRAASGAGSYVILDEAYKGLAFSPVARHEGGGLIRVRSFSKEFSMEGWRLGYAIAPEDVAKRLAAFNQITTTCVAPFVQAAGIACLENEKGILATALEAWRSRSEAAKDALSRAGFRFASPDAGIYVFATHPEIRDSGAFAMSLLEREGIAVAPGSEFGPYRSFIRICVNRQESELRELIGVMGAAANSGQP
jgi:aspartate aminotransferase